MHLWCLLDRCYLLQEGKKEWERVFRMSGIGQYLCGIPIRSVVAIYISADKKLQLSNFLVESSLSHILNQSSLGKFRDRHRMHQPHTLSNHHKHSEKKLIQKKARGTIAFLHRYMHLSNRRLFSLRDYFVVEWSYARSFQYLDLDMIDELKAELERQRESECLLELYSYTTRNSTGLL